MPVSATTVTQYYTGIFRQAPSAAVSAAYQAMTNDAAALNSMLSAANVQVDPVVRLYQTAFNRVPDSAGMTAWVVPYSTGGITLQAIANGFTQSTEFTTLYPTSMSNAQFVGALYYNILQRTGEDAGINGWVNALNSGAQTRAQVLLGFSESAEFKALIGPNVDVFLTGTANNTATYTGSLFSQNGAGTTTTFTLSVNADGPGAVPPAVNTTGTSGADEYNGAVGANEAGSTLNSFDNIAGGSGTDTVNARVVAGGLITAPVMSSVEIVNVSNAANAGDGGINLASTTGVTNVNIVNAVVGSTTSITNISATGVTLGLDNADGTSQFNISGAASRTGTSDAYSITIANGSGSGGTPAVLDIDDGAGAADATFENVNIATSGAASYITPTLGASSYRVFTVTGTAAVATTAQAGQSQAYGLTIADAGGGNAMAALRTITASGMTGTGGINVVASGSTQTTLAFTGSGGNDRVVVAGAVANAANSFNLNGGAGTSDIVAVAGAITQYTSAANLTLVTTLNAAVANGFEGLEITQNDWTDLNANNVNFSNFVFSGTSGGLAASAATVNVQTGDVFTVTQDWTGGANVDTFTFAGSVAGQSTTLNLVGGVDIAAAGTGNALTFSNGITSVTLNSSNIYGATTANTVTAATTVAAIDNASATNFTATGGVGLTIGAVAGLAAPIGFTQAVNFNASALTGVLRIAGSTSADAIVGGTAADIIYGRGGNDQLTGNGGADQYRFIAAADGTDTITDFATTGTDAIGILQGFMNVAGTTATQAGATLAAASYIDTVNNISAMTAAVCDLRVVELQTGLTAAQIAAQTSVDAMAAVVLLFNTTTGRGEVWYDTDWNDAGTRTQLATLDNVTALTGVTALTNSNFVEFVV